MYSTEYFREQINGDLAEKFVDGKTLKQFIETEDSAYSSTLDHYSLWKNKRWLVAEREENYQYIFFMPCLKFCHIENLEERSTVALYV